MTDKLKERKNKTFERKNDDKMNEARTKTKKKEILFQKNILRWVKSFAKFL